MAAFQIGLFILVWALFSDAHAGPIASDLKPIHALNRLAYGGSDPIRVLGLHDKPP